MKIEMIQDLRNISVKFKEISELITAFIEKSIDEKFEDKIEKNISDQKNANQGRIIALTDWNKYHDYPKISSFRQLLFNNFKNGSDYFVKRIGRKILICEKSYFEWINMTDEERRKNSQEAQSYYDKYEKNR